MRRIDRVLTASHLSLTVEAEAKIGNFYAMHRCTTMRQPNNKQVALLYGPFADYHSLSLHTLHLFFFSDCVCFFRPTRPFFVSFVIAACRENSHKLLQSTFANLEAGHPSLTSVLVSFSLSISLSGLRPYGGGHGVNSVDSRQSAFISHQYLRRLKLFHHSHIRRLPRPLC